MIVYNFTGRHAVVTGAGGGMGEAITLALLDAGASVTAIDIKQRPASLAAYDDRLIFAQGDLTDAAFVEQAIGTAGRERGGIDYLANVAGVLWFGRDKSALEMDLDVWDQVFNINLKSFVHTARAVVPHMRAGGRGGAMVHFSTIQWYRGDPTPQDAYQASKAGVCALSKSLAMQLAGDRIRSNAICPGMALTPLQARWDTEEKRAAVASYTPLGRIGTPQDMANAALFLLSDAASYITGIELAVDGGLLMRM
ncbi:MULTISPECIES: SDR family oxidoreductase [unclassified Mesorhizobium]|uniref:SDR family NAD(P)-dependent oxidoreductase n=1 Tax=unclassified Mesorhizobium TaxID=325217 RepID=UPI0010939D08|nr:MULTISPECIES: SDR family oxidoreductase [unclassified Mesorhizobium]TGQ94185.1 SDR family oxidoreductase [Mesorhizobium sp. M8A.F.Ca.ET.208.01.1.1]TGT54675.1 SDR family oxidoreductase [Mesorhizobium sp. M8A.F.Ca.ET.167.01.1.1]TGT90256.1 SDR family oxidoreductase [Mesorhizobium sp. M8A.F.Ca.ET.161.01.1.1]TGV42835.1 SDR family oxidoreductase [Mesorhizobium sp. M8A.F.Ca.ET.142.01.1.1]